MKKLFILLLSALSLTAVAQQKKMAVYAVDGSPISSQYANYATKAFLDSHKYMLIERNDLFMSTLAKEHIYQHSGRIDETKVARLGQQYGINYICLIRAYRWGTSFCVSGKIVDAISASIYASSICVLQSIDEVDNLEMRDSWMQKLLYPPLTKKENVAKIGIYINGGGDPYLMNLVQDVSSNVLMYADNVNVIDRNVDFIEQLDKELAYQHTGNVNDDMIISVGKQYGIDAIYAANITKDGDETHVIAHLIDVETAQIFAAAQEAILPGFLGSLQIVNLANNMLLQFNKYEQYKEWRTFINLWQHSIAKAMEHPTLRNGDMIYKGGLLNHKRTDVDGIVLLPNTKDVYFSSWKNDSPNGLGMMIIFDENPDRCVAKCPSARFYVGEWKNGKKHGKGKCYDALGRMIYNGVFYEGEPTKQYPMNESDIPQDSTFGFLLENENTFYLGELVDGKRNGLGVHIKDADIIFSTWKNNQADGHMAYIPYNGYYSSLLFKRGKPVVDDLFVELGLPSGTKWARQTSSTGFYTYEETLYKTLVSKIEIPSLDHWWELKESCKWQRLEDGYKVTGPNGNSIFVNGFDIIHAYSGVRKPKSKTDKYWSSTQIDKESAWAFECGADGKFKMAITPVKTKLAIHKILK